jgi:uncharacterized cupin superfamily protein
VSDPSFNLLHGKLEPGQFGDRPGYDRRAAQVGKLLGAKALGLSVYELEPAQKTFPYHYHLFREEWLLVLSGHPTLRSADGEQVLEPGDVAVFQAGPEGAHQLRNDGEEPARIVLFSNQPEGDAAVYPDSKKVGVMTKSTRILVGSEPQLDYWDREE